MPKFSMPVVRVFFASTLFSIWFSHHAVAADITVTTVAEEVNNNGECSLQEAVAYINRGVTEVLQDKDSDCHPEDNKPTTKILLDGDSVYNITREIKLIREVTISSNNFDGFNNQDGAQQPILKTSGNRVFLIDDNQAAQQRMVVTIQGVRLIGPFVDKSSLSAEDLATVQSEGGLIFNREQLRLERVKLRGGAAKKGGAIYNASSDASLVIENAELSNNFSNLGAAVFSELANMSIQRSLIKQNRPINQSQQGFAIEIDSADTPTEIPTINTPEKTPFELPLSRLVTNTIFYDNAVGVMTLKPGMFVNNITAIENKTGIDLETGFDSVNRDNRQVVAAKLSNSIILNSDEYDIKVSDKDFTFLNNVIVQKNRIVDINGSNSNIPTEYQDALTLLETVDNLIAFETDESGNPITDSKGAFSCRPPTVGETKGLFCPLIQLDEEYFETLKPRLLMSYTSLKDSPIVNKGKGASDSSPNALSENCENKDIRGENRELCDIGAFELVISKAGTNGSKAANDEIVYGETAILNLKDSVGDGQLIPNALDASGRHICEQYVTNPPTDPVLWPSGKVGVWVEGCLLFTRTDKVPEKGTVAVNSSADKLIYTPSSNFHGLDRFQFDIVTTTSRFSESSNDRLLRVDSVVRQDPPDTFKSETINLGYGSGTGSFGFGGLFVLLGFYGYCRKRRV